MEYRELIKTVQEYSGFSDTESKDALDGTVAVLAVHLTEPERENFAEELPEELQDLALAVYPTTENTTQDLFEQFMEVQEVDESRATRQLLSAWEALKDILSSGLVDHIRAQLPKQTTQLLQ
jgi:uncharacterized protein (DUF2267 family)